MTKKDYELIADTIVNMINSKSVDKDTGDIITGQFMARFLLDNPKFDRIKFCKYIESRT